jgi:hypothetical protein
MTETIDFLAGEVNGLRAVLLALVNTHPEHDTLHQELERLSESTTSVSNPTPVSEDYVAGQTRTINEFKDRIRLLLSR